jgi:hypothetical protein
MLIKVYQYPVLFQQEAERSEWVLPRKSSSVALGGGIDCIQQTTQSAGELVTATASGHNSDVQRSSPPSTENVSVVHSASMDAKAVQSFSYASRGVAA